MYQGKIPIRDFAEQFFTFLMPIVDRQGETHALKWRTESSLRQHFKSYQQQYPHLDRACQTKTAPAIVAEFLQRYRQDATPVKQRALLQWHLAAYLEAPAYQAALDRFRAYRDYATPSKTWEHYLHIAKCLALDLDKVAEIYHRYKPEKDNLDQHFRLELASKIRDIFHQETGQGKYSLWYALKRVSERELKRRLSISGVEAAKLPVYLAVRDALFEVYSKSGDRWLEPNAEQYQQATDYFNRHYATSVNQVVTLDDFRRMLMSCVKANQALPLIESLDDEKNKSVVAQANLSVDSPLTELEETPSQQDYQTRLVQIDQMLATQFQQLDEKDQAILKLHAQGCNQTQIAATVGINQGTVSRRYQRSQRQLLSSIAQWMHAQYQISLTTTEQLAAYIELWLTRQYRNKVPTGGIEI
jgi:RNA polymerase sigma factor (sigma-70 family)